MVETPYVGEFNSMESLVFILLLVAEAIVSRRSPRRCRGCLYGLVAGEQDVILCDKSYIDQVTHSMEMSSAWMSLSFLHLHTAVILIPGDDIMDNISCKSSFPSVQPMRDKSQIKQSS